MRLVFFGTPDYVLPILKALAKDYEISAVVTQNPKPVGRKQFLQYSPVDNWAHKRKIPVFYPAGADRDLTKIPKADLGILAAYGKIIPEFLISNFKFSILNIHPSLLPKYRGASPVQAAIAAGDKETGVSIIKMDAEIDHGPIISQFKEEILPEDTTGTLRTRLFARSAEVLIELLPAYLAGKIKPKEQDHSQASYTKILKKEDGYLDLAKTKPEIAERFIRAMDPWPGAWTYLKPDDQGSKAKRLKILKAHLDINHQSLILDTVQLEGKNPVSWKQFKEAYPELNF